MVDNSQPAAGTTPAATGGLQPTDYAPAPTSAAPGAPGAEQPLDPYAGKVEQWKRQHREVTEITIKAGESAPVRCFIKNPDRNMIAFALTLTMNKKLLEAGEFLLNNCWLGGDERCNPASEQADDRLVIAAAMEAATTIELLAASSKKL